MKALHITAVLTLVCFSANLLTGCTSWKPMGQGGMSRQEVVASINPGDRLIVQTKDSSKYKVTVDSIDTFAIVGGGLRYQLSNIDEIYIKQLSGPKNAGLTAAGIAVSYIVGFLVVIGALGAALAAG